MKSHGLIMKPSLAQAAFEGQKTQTRRVGERYEKWRVGDQIYVKETHKYWDWDDDGNPCIAYFDGHENWPEVPETHIKTVRNIWEPLSVKHNENHGLARDQKWRPSIHMPRWAARTVATITSIRQEQLHDITMADAIAEGVENDGRLGGFYYKDYSSTTQSSIIWSLPISSFISLWNSIGGEDAWDDNPLVWRIEFERVNL